MATSFKTFYDDSYKCYCQIVVLGETAVFGHSEIPILFNHNIQLESIKKYYDNLAKEKIDWSLIKNWKLIDIKITHE